MGTSARPRAGTDYSTRTAENSCGMFRKVHRLHRNALVLKAQAVAKSLNVAP